MSLPPNPSLVFPHDHIAMECPRLHALMLAGTGSDVGKSVLTTAFCRIFRQDGFSPAPFKAQNMALNSFATPDGLEIGRAQAVQAEAAGLLPESDMNPLLLKPHSDHTSQIVLNGRVAGNTEAYDYFRKSPQREQLRLEVERAYDRLAARFNPVVLEGAGSVCELNLRDTDLANMPMAAHADADVLLVGDIDRGGVFASLYGSVMLQRPEDRQRIKGILVNKFRGDLRLFEEGRHLIEQICGVPVLGVIPYYNNIYVEEEDSVALARKARKPQEGKVNVAVVCLPHISNYTDFDVLEHHPSLHLYFTENPADVLVADVVVLPGSKSVLSDLEWLRTTGLANAVVQMARGEQAVVLGICGGYQMMGRSVSDPHREEGVATYAKGLGLLPVTTELIGTKRTRQSRGRDAEGHEVVGYEIHQGRSERLGGEPLFVLDDGTQDGCCISDCCMGTYLHGVLDNVEFLRCLLKPLGVEVEDFDYAKYRVRQFDLLAAHVRQHVNMELLYKILTAND